MFSTRKLWISFIIIMVLTMGTLSYELFFMKGPDSAKVEFSIGDDHHEHHEHHEHREHGEHEEHREHGEGGWKDFFNQLGTFSIYAGVIAMTWLVMKRMIKTKIVPLKWAAKFTFKIHYWIGWIAVILTAAHATYWLITSFNHRHTWDGISATISLFALAVYGWMMIKSRQKKFMRKLHLTLAIVFLAVLFFHAGEELIQAVIIMLLAWLFVYVVNKYTSKRKTHA